MSSIHLVDPDLLPILEAAPNFGVSEETLEQARAGIAELTRYQIESADDSVDLSEHIAPGSAGEPDVRIVLYRPKGLRNDAPAVLQIHGGGFVFGTAELGDPRNRALAKAAACVVASVEYRLAPEASYPAALNDCYAALEWLHANASALSVDPRRIAVRGESAGGGIAAALTILTRERKGPPILFQVLIYPMLDDRTCAEHSQPLAGEFVWNEDSNSFAWRSWLGTAAGSVDVPPLAAPARVADLRGLPPTFLGTAALDLFMDENLQYVRRLARAGVPTEVYVAPGAFHGFDALAPEAAVSRRFNELADAALRRAFEA
jgi:triacylglycerol lipase